MLYIKSWKRISHFIRMVGGRKENVWGDDVVAMMIFSFLSITCSFSCLQLHARGRDRCFPLDQKRAGQVSNNVGGMAMKPDRIILYDQNKLARKRILALG